MKHIAIIGCGPRGLSALENLVSESSKNFSNDALRIVVFDPCDSPGAGPVWNLDQSHANWVNISDRALKQLPSRGHIEWGEFQIAAFPSFNAWNANASSLQDDAIDSFPPRSRLGAYLHERYKTIATILVKHGILDVIQEKIVALNFINSEFSIKSERGNLYKADECLLTIGHQPTKDDTQLKTFEDHAQQHEGLLFKDPYDMQIDGLVESEQVVTFRGMGLSMIDNVRLLTLERGAQFVESEDSILLRYQASDTSVKKLIPFSLDGIFPSPKPLGKEVDQYFMPSDEQKEYFRSEIKKALSIANSIDTPQFIIDSVAKIAANNYFNLGPKALPHDLSVLALEVLCKRWLADMKTEHKVITDSTQSCENYMKEHSAMAMGKVAFSLDYYVGQLWRHLQPIMYKALSYCSLNDETMEKIIKLDESTKRYSFGPPVESILQLIALIEADVIDTNFSNDPEIVCIDSGWQLKSRGKSIKVDVMVNCVLDRPKLVSITSSLVRNLLEDEWLQPVTSELGVDTRKDGLVVMTNTQSKFPLAMLGRNCKGSKMGVDAILECFDKDTKTWAEGVCQRLT